MQTLAIIERAFRGTAEQQYAHVLWLVHGLHRLSPMVVVLRGTAAAYALAGPGAAPLRVGGAAWGRLPDYQAAVARLTADGARVVVARSSLRELCIDDRQLLAEVQKVDDEEIAVLVEGCDRVWYL
jgi:intracellular sulfur oxidation DsrE/DsrF family protein